MSVYNDVGFVEDAVRSILAQTFLDFELLVIDDGSSDGSADVVAELRDARIRIIRNEANVGLTRSLNIGLRAARGDLIARQDADDISLPERLQRQVAVFDGESQLALLGAQALAASEKGAPLRFCGSRRCTAPLAIEWSLMFENPFVHSSVMFRRDVILNEFGGYDEAFCTSQDFELWSRVVRRYPCRNLDEVLLLHRQRARSVSKGYSLEALRRVCDRSVENRAWSLRRVERLDLGLCIFMAANNPGVCAPPVDVRPFIDSVRETLRRFEEIHPFSSASPEIRDHIASLFIRMANLMAPHAPAGAVQALAAALEFNRKSSWRASPLVGVRVLLGILGHGRASGTQALAPALPPVGDRS